MVKLVWIVIGLLSLTGCWGKPNFSQTLGSRLNHIDLQKFTLQEQHLDAELNSYRFTLADQTLLVREQPMTSSEESRFIDDREFLVSSLYKTRRTPYPGEITATNECREDQLPKKHSHKSDSSSALGFDLWANERFMYGQCTDEGRKLRSIYAIIVCSRSKRGYEVKLFAPAQSTLPDTQQFLREFHCVN